MDYVEGETLGERVGTRGPLTVGEATRIVYDVARALRCAHRRGVVHRNLKPDNVMIERATGRAVVMDQRTSRAMRKTMSRWTHGRPRFWRTRPASSGGSSRTNRSAGRRRTRVVSGRAGPVGP